MFRRGPLMEAGTMNYDATHRKTAKDENKNKTTKNRKETEKVCGMTRTRAATITLRDRRVGRRVGGWSGHSEGQLCTMRCQQTKANQKAASGSRSKYYKQFNIILMPSSWYPLSLRPATQPPTSASVSSPAYLHACLSAM